ncbi:flagellar biosynthetic protein FliP [Reinekea marinisedimentorum]|uniref:Flagellar biosynthetic protein FliP n=2 Tax=Reinekea marinisedimentorum TaxID=230495 RepID=A0A4V2UK17_9GAMM|nr:flagellar biosynthetic protein FliP [Reinekea marinisedimentorum]
MIHWPSTASLLTIRKISFRSLRAYRLWFCCLTVLTLFSLSMAAQAAGIPAIELETTPEGGTRYSVTLQILALMTALGFLPAILIMMTSFTRIVVVFAILRQAIGLQQTPSNQMLIGLALFLTFFIMSPVFNQINAEALQPYLAEEMAPVDAVNTAIEPLKKFMLAQTRESDLMLFMELADKVGQIESPEDTPLTILMPAFATSELKTAFQIGFLLFIPFLIIDLVIASILMAMGMMMLSPIIISLPFKIMLFVLVDGWAMVMGSVAASFNL